jgi:hypothetical protein
VFVQIMEARLGDAEAVKRVLDRWEAELRPGAAGFLGSTGGVTADGRLILLARFESEEAARANSDRPEQGEWFAEFEQQLDGPVSFAESSDVDLFLAGGSDDAGFVQVMKVTGADRATLGRLDKLFEKVAPTMRPDLLGATRAWTSPTDYVELAYFTSEAEARRNEAAEPPEELRAAMAEFEDLMSHTEFLDLSDPWLH